MEVKISINVLPEKLLTRVWESIDGAIAGIASPWQIRREGKARADVRRVEALIDAQTKRDVEAIVAGTSNVSSKLLASPIERLTLPPTGEQSTSPIPHEPGSPKLVASTPAELASISDLRTRVDAIKKLLNLRTVHRTAEEVIESEYPDREPPETRPSRDWLAAWRNGAEAASDEDLQRLWARLLCEEVVKPNSYSRRAIETLRVLDHKEAKILSKIAPYIMDDAIFRTKEKIETGIRIGDGGELEIPELSFGELIDLEHAGLLGQVSGFLTKTLRTRPMTNDQHALVLSTPSEKYVLIVFSQQIEVNVSAIPVAPVARELVRLGKFEPNEENILRLSDAVVRKSGVKEISVNLVNIIQKNSGEAEIVQLKKIESPQR